MRRGPSPCWRASLGAALALAAGCSPQIVLGDADSALCVDSGCGGAVQSGSGGLAGSVAGSEPQAGSGPAPVAGSGGSVPTAAGDSGAGGDAGPVGGRGGAGPSGPACQPAAVDQSCDGLNEACEPTMQDQGCVGMTCTGTFVQGTSYMSCLAANDFDSAEARCQANGMHLAKIDSAAENATVVSLARDDYVWLGGSNRDDPNVFVWPDGTTFYSAGAAVTGVYENFGAGGPSQDPALRCVQLRRTGIWSSWQCAGMQSFVCERY